MMLHNALRCVAFVLILVAMQCNTSTRILSSRSTFLRLVAKIPPEIGYFRVASLMQCMVQCPIMNQLSDTMCIEHIIVGKVMDILAS